MKIINLLLALTINYCCKTDERKICKIINKDFKLEMTSKRLTFIRNCENIKRSNTSKLVS